MYRNFITEVQVWCFRINADQLIKRSRTMMVKLTQDLARGLGPWKEMYHENQTVLNALGARLIFAGTEKDDDSKLTVIIDFDSVEAMKAFGGHEELKAKRAAAGALLETTAITVMSADSFTG